MLLAIDTSAGTSVAVVDADGAILAEHGTSDTMRHAEVVGELIAAVLGDAAVRPGALAGVVAGMGPGPFTGLRVGIAAARAFALGIDRPLRPAVSHDAIALDRYRGGAGGGLLVVTDARRRELYWSRYAGTDDAGLPVRVEGPALAKPDALPAASADLARIDAHTVSAGALGLLAVLGERHGRPLAGEQPLYLRSPDVTLAPAKRVSA